MFRIFRGLTLSNIICLLLALSTATVAPLSLSPVNLAGTSQADPYAWHAFWGSNLDDISNDITVDPEGNLYIVGESSSFAGPHGEPPLYPHNGYLDIAIIKMSPNGEYLWHAFFGTSSYERGSSVAVIQDSVYILATSYETWNGPDSTAPLNPFQGGQDFTVIKLDTDGNYQWHTFIGGASGEWSKEMVIDATGNLVFIGHCHTSWDGPSGQPPINPHSTGNNDFCAVKMSGSGIYQWHTFFGCTANNNGNALSLDGPGNIYLAGLSYGNWNGPAGTPPIDPYSDRDDMVLIKLEPSGGYLWHTFLGGTAFDGVYDLDISGSAIYLAGASSQTWYGPSGQLPKNSHSGLDDLAVVKLTTSGDYTWHTFFGSSVSDVLMSIQVVSDHLELAGYSYGSWNGPDEQLPLNPYNGLQDIVTLELDLEGDLSWHTFYGSNQVDRTHSAIFANGNYFITGYSTKYWAGPAYQLPLTNFYAGKDIFVIRQDAHMLSPESFDFGFTLQASTLLLYPFSEADPWSLSESLDWLSLSITSGTGAAVVVLSVDRSGLSVGSYSGYIYATVSGQEIAIPVELEVSSSDYSIRTYLPSLQK